MLSMQHGLEIAVRLADAADLEAVRAIYNEGVEDGIATLEMTPKSLDDMMSWWNEHDDRYTVVVAVLDTSVVGWASLNRFSNRCAHDAIADLSVYVARMYRGRGIGEVMLDPLEQLAREAGFHKIVLHALDQNEAGKRLYSRCGFDRVGVFREHGTIGDRYVDVVAMEKLLVEA